MAPGKLVFEFTHDRLHVGDDIHIGRFYKIVKAMAWYINGKDGTTQVAIKMVNDSDQTRANILRGNLLKEIKLLKRLSSNRNVTKLLGCCTRQDPVYLITEYAPHGDLKTFLTEHRKQSENATGGFSQNHLLSFAIDVAKGMEYLAENKVIHRYLAAKHVLVYEGKTCKISGFSYASDVVSDHDFFEMNKNCLPYRWMALESLTQKEFTFESDVWSFGVVLYEIITQGDTPYMDMKKIELISALKGGRRMKEPDNCGELLYETILSCSKTDPRSRPTFSMLLKTLHDLNNSEEEQILHKKHSHTQLE
ncbi:tyrosine kinase receptor Cad96Ca-like [Ptychodera flava]|uniref:tyrosine kinase receptor Cad96Ca-like n=1 Tax=Ptychodera flava TaxID=63121 RepID=UPI00396A0E78